MNFEDEHYVRIYTKDTKTWLRWGWEGQAVFMFVDRKLDKAGILEDVDEENAVEDLALLTGLPADVVRVGLPRVLKSGTFELHGGKLICPNYIEANTARKSQALRSKEYRERRRDEARGSATPPDTPRNSDEQESESRDGPSHNVTNEKHNVAQSHSASHGATRASPKSSSRADQDTPHTPQGVGGGDGRDLDDPTLPCPSVVLPDEVVQQLANHYRVPIEAIREAEKGFKTYWTVGKGAGSRFRRGMWIRKCRDRIQTLSEQDKLGPTEPTVVQPSAVDPEEVRRREEAAERAADERFSKYRREVTG